MPDFLFDHILQINTKILKSGFIFLLLDYDGTLIPFKDKPSDVTTPKKIKKIIRELIKNQKIMVIIVTGRSLYDIKKLLNINGLSFIALHGLCIETSDGVQFSWKQSNQVQLLIKQIKKDIEDEIKKENGAFLEDKGLTLVLHYRLLSINKIQKIKKKFKNAVNTNDRKNILEIINGEKVIETRPKGWNKGKAIEMLLTKYAKKKDIFPIYIGDDITDEDAFKVLKKRGISIYVANQSKRMTTARYWVKNPDEVFCFLQSLSQLLNQG